MKLQIKLEIEDFVNHQMFTAFQSSLHKRREIRNWILTTVFTLFPALYFYFIRKDWFMTIWMGTFTILVVVFFSRFNRYYYRRYYRKIIKEHYSNTIGIIADVEIQSDYIYSKDRTTEGKIKLSEVDVVNEIPDYFFIKISTGISLIIPKRMVNEQELRQKLDSLGLKIITYF